MVSLPGRRLSRRVRALDALLAALLLLGSYAVFRLAPIRQAGDSRYSLLLADNLLRHRELALERYALPEGDYRLERVGGHTYYSFPSGTSLLSVPLVALARARGLGPTRPDGGYDLAREASLDALLAALLTALFTALAYCTARLLLPVRHALALALVGAFGTQALSSLSRALWSDTWGVLLVTLAVFLLLRSAVRARPPSPALLGTLAGWAYLVRPTNALAVAAVALYLALTARRALAWYALFVGAWLALFAAGSWRVYHALLPPYFLASRLSFRAPLTALAGSVVSPSRGLLVYVPAVWALGLVLWASRRALAHRPLALAAGGVCVAHLAMLSGFEHWWGGHSYGARLSAGLVPWLLLLGILALDGLRRAPSTRALFVAAGLCGASVAVNAVGAFSLESARWNSAPEPIDAYPSRLWSWRRAQLLAPLVPPGPAFVAAPNWWTRAGATSAGAWLGPGWSACEQDFCWTDGPLALLRVGPAPAGSGALELELRPYLGPQRVRFALDGASVAEWRVEPGDFSCFVLPLPRGALGERRGVLTLGLPDAASPAQREGLGDTRLLGVAVRALRWREGSGEGCARR